MTIGGFVVIVQVTVNAAAQHRMLTQRFLTKRPPPHSEGVTPTPAAGAESYKEELGVRVFLLTDSGQLVNRRRPSTPDDAPGPCHALTHKQDLYTTFVHVHWRRLRSTDRAAASAPQATRVNRREADVRLFGGDLRPLAGDGVLHGLQLLQQLLAAGQRVAGFVGARSPRRAGGSRLPSQWNGAFRRGLGGR